MMVMKGNCCAAVHKKSVRKVPLSGAAFQQANSKLAGELALQPMVERADGQRVLLDEVLGNRFVLVRNFLNIDYDGTRNLLGELFIIHLRSDEIANLYPNREPFWHTWIGRPGFYGLLVSPDASKTDYVIHRPFAPQEGERLEEIVDAALGTKTRL